jgi:hypothetical protein
MLNRLEQKVVSDHKARQFGAYLQWALPEYPDLQEQIGNARFPEPSRLTVVRNKMGLYRIEFDYYYLISLPRAKVNPLQLEQKAWRLLSPRVKQHLGEFGNYIAKYSQQNPERERLLTHINCGWELLQKWNVISKSYKAKHGKVWTVVSEREEATKQLIQELSAQLSS